MFIVYYIPGATPQYVAQGKACRIADGTNYPAGWPVAEIPGAVAPPGYSPETEVLEHPPTGWNVRPKTADELTADALQRKTKIINSLQQRLDTWARERGYDSIHSLVGYVGDPDAIFSAEGLRGQSERSRTWRAATNILMDVLAGTRGMPTVDEILIEIPPPTWA